MSSTQLKTEHDYPKEGKRNEFNVIKKRTLEYPKENKRNKFSVIKNRASD